MVTPEQLSGAALGVVTTSTRDERVAAAAERRRRSLGAPALPPVRPQDEVTASRALHDARVAIDAADFSFADVRGMLEALATRPGCGSEALVLLAAARVREAQRLRASGDEQGAARLAVDALRDLSSALSADATNREGLVLLDRIEELTGHARLTNELRRAVS